MSLLTINAQTTLGYAKQLAVKILLTDNLGKEINDGFDGTGHIVQRAEVITDNNGNCSIDLLPNAQITPPNSCYTVWLGPKSFLIIKTGATQTLQQARVTTPPALGLSAQLQNLADVNAPAPADKEVLSWDAPSGRWVPEAVDLSGAAGQVQSNLNTEATTRATQDALRVLKAGDTMSGALAMGTNRIIGLGDATAATDALNRQTGDARYDATGAATTAQAAAAADATAKVATETTRATTEEGKAVQKAQNGADFSSRPTTRANLSVHKQLALRIAVIGDSITAQPALASDDNVAPYANSRPHIGSYPYQLQSRHPDKYTITYYGGVGGDVTGGQAHIVGTGSANGIAPIAGATVITVALDYGSKPWNTSGVGVYVGGYTASVAGPNDGHTVNAVTTNGDGTYTLTLATGLVSGWGVGALVNWGALARLEVMCWNTGAQVCILIIGTNDIAALTSVGLGKAIRDICFLNRQKGVETLVCELLPRTVYGSQIVAANVQIRYWCGEVEDPVKGGPYHVIPTHATFAAQDGTFADANDTLDGLHLKRQGIAKFVDIVDNYISTWVDARPNPIRPALITVDPTSLITIDSWFTAANGTDSAGGNGFIPHAWVNQQFFGTGWTCSLVAPSAGDKLPPGAQWFRLAFTGATAGSMAISFNTAAAAAIGNMMSMALRVQGSGTFGTVTANCWYNDGSGFNLNALGGLTNLTTAFDLTAAMRNATSANTATHQIYLGVAAGGAPGTGYIQFAIPACRDLTALGIS